MIEAGRCVSWAACEIDSKPTNEMIASDAPSSRCSFDGHANCIVWISRSGLNANRKPKKRIEVSLTTSSAETTPLKRGRLPYADHVEQTQSRDETEGAQKMHPGMRRQREDRHQLAEIVDARPGEERDVDREVEQHGPAGDEPKTSPSPRKTKY